MSIQTISRYEIEDKLGEGGMGEIFLARDPYMKRRVAIKVLSHHLTTKEHFLEYFQREAEVIAALEHPCIVPIYDYGRHGTQPFIVMRYMPGGSLKERLHEECLKPRPLSRIVERVAAGLDAAHAQGIIHRDVKPSNILFDAKGEAFLADFGLAKYMQRSSSKTQGIVIGTPEYMSPEQIRNKELDGRSDVYALGVVLFCALAGRPPFVDDSPMAIAIAHITDCLPNILDIKPDLPSSLEEVICKATAKDPAERYATAGELARDVAEIASGRWFYRKLVAD